MSEKRIYKQRLQAALLFLLVTWGCGLAGESAVGVENAFGGDSAVGGKSTGGGESAVGGEVASDEAAANAPASVNLDDLVDFMYPSGMSTFHTTLELAFIAEGEEEPMARISATGATDLPAISGSWDRNSPVRAEGPADFAEWFAPYFAQIDPLYDDEFPVESFYFASSAPVQRRAVDGVFTMLEEGRCNVLDVPQFVLTAEADMVEINPASLLQSEDSPSYFLRGQAELAEAGVMINGRLAHRYSLGLDNFTLIWMPIFDLRIRYANGEEKPATIGGEELLLSELTSGDLYLDAAEGFVVRLAFEAAGMPLGLEYSGSRTVAPTPIPITGRIHYELDHFDYDQPVVTDALAECDSTNPDIGLPIFPGALQVNHSGGSDFVSYIVPARVSELVDFYKVELAAQGYQFRGEQVFEWHSRFLNFDGPNGELLSVDLQAVPPITNEEEVHSFQVDVFVLQMGP